MISRLIKDLFRVYPYFDRNREHRRWLLSSYETLRGDFIRRFLPFSLSLPFSLPFRTTAILFRVSTRLVRGQFYGLYDTR